MKMMSSLRLDESSSIEDMRALLTASESTLPFESCPGEASSSTYQKPDFYWERHTVYDYIANVLIDASIQSMHLSNPPTPLKDGFSEQTEVKGMSDSMSPQRMDRLMCIRSFAVSESMLVTYDSTTPLWNACLSYQEMVDPVWESKCHPYVCFHLLDHIDQAD